MKITNSNAKNEPSIQDDYFTGSYLLLVIGALITIIGFLGCCGAWKESSCMLGSFFALLLVIFIGEICFCVYVYFQFKNEALDAHYFSTHLIDKSIEETVMKKYEYNISSASVHTFDKIQEELECCGVKGPQDWADSVYNKHGKNSPPPDLYKIPISCCRVPESKACIISTQLGRSDQPDSVILYTEGCAEKMKTYAEENQFIAVAVLIAIGVLEILGMCLSMFLCCTISRIRNMKA
jgi:hypothetical protein